MIRPPSPHANSWPGSRHSASCAYVAVAALALAGVAAYGQGAAPTPQSTSSQAGSRLAPLRAVTPKPLPPASAPNARLRPLDQTGNSAIAPGERQPERPVAAPQVNLRLGRTPPAPTAGESADVARRSGRRDGIDDSAARCEAQSDPRARARCRGAGS